MNQFLKYLSILFVMGMTACSLYYYAPLYGYMIASGLNVGAPALPYYAYSNTTLEVIDREFKTANAKVTIEDTYAYAYKKPFKNIPPDGDTGQTFTNMETATRYLQDILSAKGVTDSKNYFMTSIDSARTFGFTLIAAVYRPDEKVTVYDKFGASSEETITCDDPPFYQPYRFDCKGNPLDTVYEWAAVPNDCFEKQGHQAILLTLTANKLLEKKPKPDYWQAERKWIAGNYKSVVVDQDYMVCQALGIETGYTEQKNIFKD